MGPPYEEVVSLSKSAVEVPTWSRTVGMGPFILMTKSPVIVFLHITSQYMRHETELQTDDLPVDSVTQGDLMALLFADLESPRRVFAGVCTTNNVVVSSAAYVIGGELEGQLRIAVDSDVNEVGDGDCFGNGEAGEKSGGGELHVDGFLEQERKCRN
jgi:hypothetical protein